MPRVKGFTGSKKRRNNAKRLKEAEEKETSESRLDELDTMTVDFLDDEEDETKRVEYKKRPLSDPTLTMQSRRNRVKEMRKIFAKWSDQCGVKPTQLAGLFLHLENYNSNRSLAQVGFKIFLDGQSDINMS